MIARLTLRDRLRVLRRSALSRLTVADQLDGELLRLVAETSIAIAAIDIEAGEGAPPLLGDRALVVDDNATVQIVVFSNDRRAAAATLTPAAAIRLGNQLIAAGVRRL